MTISSLRTICTYVLIVSLFAIASWLVIGYGKTLPAAVGERAAVSTRQVSGTAPLGTLLLQITVTLAAARTFGWFLRKIGQPSVIGEILAGVVLGPTIFGRFAPPQLGT